MGQKLKDEVLNDLLENGNNIARFVSFKPDQNGNPLVRFDNISIQKDTSPDFGSLVEKVTQLYHECNGLLSIRTFLPDKPDGNPFKFDQTDLDKIIKLATDFIKQGYYVIVNEGLPIFGMNSQVSGVMFGNLIEFAPAAGPRCVEKGDTCKLPRNIGLSILSKIFGNNALHKYSHRASDRVEFSLYPYPCGYFKENLVVWQVDKYEDNDPVVPKGSVQIKWPNPFSATLGDKAFGLMIADALGFSIPTTKIINRYHNVFSINPTMGHSLNDVWYRTCPSVRAPGKLPTVHGDADIFELMKQSEELTAGTDISVPSILVQENINADYSGSVITTRSGRTIIEGVAGHGDEFMLGNVRPEKLPPEVEAIVMSTIDMMLSTKLLPNEIEFEWVYAMGDLYVVQLCVGSAMENENTVYPDNGVEGWHTFDPTKNDLTYLENLISVAQQDNCGITVIGPVGRTSHIVHALIKAQIPSYIQESITHD